jgi:uncharacterized protein YxeA
MSDIITLPFPLFDDTDRYRSVGRVFGNGSCMIVALADPFPVVHPWKECAIYFEQPRSPYKAPLRVTVNGASVVRARTRANAAPQRGRTKVTRPWPAGVRPAWQDPATTKPLDPDTKLIFIVDDLFTEGRLNDPARLDTDYLARLIQKEYVTKQVFNPTQPTEERIYSKQQKAELARAGNHSQIKFDAGPFWVKHGRYFGLQERKQDHWHYIGRKDIPEPTEACLTLAFSVMLYYAGEINKRAPHLCGAAGDACRAYQAAAVFRKYWFHGWRIRADDMVRAHRVIEAFDEHLRQDRKITWKRLTAVLDVLEGDSFRTAAVKHGIDHTSLYQWFDDEVLDIERTFGHYCTEYLPPQKASCRVYTGRVRRKSAKPHTWRMSRSEREKLIDCYLGLAKATKSWLTENLIEWLCRFYRTTRLRVLIRYPKLRTKANEAYQAIADYLKKHGKITKYGAAYDGGTAPYRGDKRSTNQILADKYGEPAGPDPFELFDQPKPQRLRDDVEYGIDEKIAETPFLDNQET